MATTALDLINGSMRLIGVLASGETLPSSEANDALLVLNQMLDSWSTDNLLIFADVQESFTLTSGQQTYTMGTGGNFNTTRPQRIENAVATISNGSQSFDNPIDILSQDEWVDIRVKGATASFPTKLYAEGSYPLETIQLYPVPSTATTLTLWTWKPLTNFSTLQTAVSLPPGYQKALKYNLALDLASEYGKPADQLVIAQAIATKDALRALNNKPTYLGMDDALVPSSSAFNWYTGD